MQNIIIDVLSVLVITQSVLILMSFYVKPSIEEDIERLTKEIEGLKVLLNSK